MFNRCSSKVVLLAFAMTLMTVLVSTSMLAGRPLPLRIRDSFFRLASPYL